MKLLFTLFAFVAAGSAFAGVFLEPLQGTDKIYRGRAPKASEMRQLQKAGITSVIIFKNQVKSEVDEEIQLLLDAGIAENKIHHIPFLWKDITSEKLACEQVIEALKILQKIEMSSGEKVLFHCTVGEDRTGLLAGLMIQILNQENSDESYRNQMCAKGYAGGNQEKPPKVSQAVDKFLTPLYFKLSAWIEQGELSSDSLNKQICKKIGMLAGRPQYKTCSEIEGR